MKKVTKWVVTGLAVGLSACGGQLPAEESASPELATVSQGITDSPATHIKVYNANTHKNSFGDVELNSDIRNLTAYMATRDYRPDVVTLQEVGVFNGTYLPHGRYCNGFYNDLAARAGGTYACAATNAHGGSAVMYRTPRFSLVGTPVEFSLKKKIGTTCTTNYTSPYKGIAVRLYDKSSGIYVNVASVHFPVESDADGGDRIFGDDCTSDNMDITVTNVNSLGSGMKIIGGDMNHGDASRTGEYPNPVTHNYWESAYTRNLSNFTGSTYVYRDVLLTQCIANTGAVYPFTGSPLAGCLENAGTLLRTDADARIDWLLFNRSSATVVSANTIGWSNNHLVSPLDYSDHRAQEALIRY